MSYTFNNDHTLTGFVTDLAEFLSAETGDSWIVEPHPVNEAERVLVRVGDDFKLFARRNVNEPHRVWLWRENGEQLLLNLATFPRYAVNKVVDTFLAEVKQ